MAMSTTSAIRPLLRLRVIPSCLARRCASSASRASRSSSQRTSRTLPRAPSPKLDQLSPRTPPKLPTPVRGSTVPALDSVSLQMRELPLEYARKQSYAQKVYASGRTAVYRPPSHFGIYAASWLMGCSAIASAGLLAYSNIWAWEGNTDLHWIVPATHRVSIAMFTAMGTFIIMRSLRFVRSIDLVSVDGMVKMAVQVRRPLPFLQPKEYLIAPYQFQMNPKFVRRLEYPESMKDEVDLLDSRQGPARRGFPSKIGRFISQAIYYPFASTRRLLTLEGFMWVGLEGVSGKFKLDTQGWVSSTDLKEMGTFSLSDKGFKI